MFREDNAQKVPDLRALKPTPFRSAFVLPEGHVYSDWTPWPPSKWRPIGNEAIAPSADDDLSIPDFLKR
jgi:hypothetical protein